MPVNDAKPRKEREDTDASLLAERARTDAELLAKQAVLHDDENRVVEVARELAEETLGVARELADRHLENSGATRLHQSAVATERAVADSDLANEQAAADARLRSEREEHRRALAAVLRLERDATDEGLSVERARADEIVATRDDFLGIVSHDIRNILGNILMSAEGLAKRATTGGVAENATVAAVERIQRGAARMNRLVGDLLDVVSLEAGALHIFRSQHDASQLAKEAVEAYQPSFSRNGISLSQGSQADPIIADLDHDRVLQVLANLLSNALKFTDNGGQVKLLVAKDGSTVQFTVTDSGVGIPPDQTTAIFERFGQVRKDRRGHGLGLYISKCIVEAHGGRIWVESPQAGGTAVHFTIPDSASVNTAA